jgi:hypothetical protein
MDGKAKSRENQADANLLGAATQTTRWQTVDRDADGKQAAKKERPKQAAFRT